MARRDTTPHARVSVPLSCDTRGRRESEQKEGEKKEKEREQTRRGRGEERGGETKMIRAAHRDESDTLDGFTRDPFFPRSSTKITFLIYHHLPVENSYSIITEKRRTRIIVRYRQRLTIRSSSVFSIVGKPRRGSCRKVSHLSATGYYRRGFLPLFPRPPSRRERVPKNSFRAKENSPDTRAEYASQGSPSSHEAEP